MSEQAYIYRVSFKNEPAGDNVWITDHFFGSLSAIYDTFTAEQIGCKVSRLWNLKITPQNPYLGRKCTISKEPLVRKKKSSTSSKNEDKTEPSQNS